jgi:hypothetical protein
MRPFLRNLALFFFVHLCLWSLVLWSYTRQRPFGTEVGAIVNDKQELLENQTSPRIILIGGSNLNFGIRSPEIERRTGYHPVNMGLNIGDGLAFMLNNVRSSLRRGDVVVVSPEYEHFGDFYNGKGEFLYAEVEHRPSVIGAFTTGNYLEMLNKGHMIAGSILRYTLERRGNMVRQYLENKENPYRRDAFNQYGDLVGHYPLTLRLKKSELIVGPSASQVTPEKIVRAINGLNEFNEECRRREVQVFYSFPPIPQELFENDATVIKTIASELQRRLQFTILDTPEEATYPIENFFDGYYHLTGEGSEKRTDRLINKLAERGINSAGVGTPAR